MTKLGLSHLQSVKFNLTILDFFFIFKAFNFFFNDIRKVYGRFLIWTFNSE